VLRGSDLVKERDLALGESEGGGLVAKAHPFFQELFRQE